MSLYRILSILVITFSFSIAACPDGTEVCLSLGDQVPGMCSDSVSADQTTCEAVLDCDAEVCETEQVSL